MYRLRYDPHVFRDLKKLDRSSQAKILKQIQKKLVHAPDDFGKPLRHELKGYWRLRVDDYRVIYEINRKTEEVTIWMVGQRKDDLVYLEFLKRMKGYA